MTRKDAEKLIGTRVAIWTAANGEYVGILEEVFGSPWRGRVRITGVLSPAQAYELGRPGGQRRGFRPDDAIDVGGVNIKPTDQEGTSYLVALRGDLARLQELMKSATGSRHQWAIEAAIKARQGGVAQEAVNG